MTGWRLVLAPLQSSDKVIDQAVCHVGGGIVADNADFVGFFHQINPVDGRPQGACGDGFFLFLALRKQGGEQVLKDKED